MADFKPFNLAESLRAGQQLQLGDLQLAAGKQQLQIGQQQLQRQQALRDIATAATGPIDQVSKLQQAGEIKSAGDLMSQIKTMDDLQRKQKKVESEAVAKQAFFANTEEKWGVLMEKLVANGDVPAPVPFDHREEIMAQAMTFKDVLDGKKLDMVQHSIDVPGEGVQLIRRSGKVDFIPYGIEGRQAHIKSQLDDIKHARKKKAAVKREELLAKARQDMENDISQAAFGAREQIPLLNNLEQLAQIASTGTFGELRMAAKRAFGIDVATEEEFQAEATRIILDAAESLKGALSERENRYLEGVAPDINKSVEGNLRIIKNLKRIAQNAIARQNAWRDFDGNPIEFDFQGEELEVDSAVKKAQSKSKYAEDEIYINPKTNEQIQFRGGVWQPRQTPQ